MTPIPKMTMFKGFKIAFDEWVPKGFMEIRNQNGRVDGLVFIGFQQDDTSATAPCVSNPPPSPL